MNKERSAGAIIFHTNERREYLLLHYRYKTEYWDFVKGNIEANETPEDTIVREIKEETGLSKTRPLAGFIGKTSWVYMRDGILVHKEVTYFLHQSTTKAIQLSTEHIGFGWFGFGEAIDKITHKNSRELLERAELFLNKREKESLHTFMK